MALERFDFLLAMFKMADAAKTLGHAPGEGYVSYMELYRYVPSQRVWFLSRFGLKMGIDFEHYGLKSGMVFKRTTRAYKRVCLFNSK